MPVPETPQKSASLTEARFLTKQELDNSPTHRDGLSAKEEDQWRRSMCQLLSEAAPQLKA
jgi:hypothetical protein